MKFFPLKIAICCLALTPILYILSLNASHHYLERHYLQNIQNILIGDPGSLLNGTTHLEEQIAKNITRYLKTDPLKRYVRLNIHVQVTTGRGKIIFPMYVNTTLLTNEINREINAETIAEKNFETLNLGLDVSVTIDLAHGSRLANFILFIYLTISLSVFSVFYRIGNIRAKKARQFEKNLIQDLKRTDQSRTDILETLKSERRELFESIETLNLKYQTDKNKAKLNEEEMFDEIISLEEKLNSFISLKAQKEEEIQALKSTLEKQEHKKRTKSKRSEYGLLEKRFSTLYKHLTMNRKALAGFSNLTDDQQIKAEELIQQLDLNPEKVIIKRKVFSGKKNKTACFEVLFAYNGRLYFKKQDNTIEVLVIGNKNTQTRDMEFIHNL